MALNDEDLRLNNGCVSVPASCAVVIIWFHSVVFQEPQLLATAQHWCTELYFFIRRDLNC